MPERVCTRAWGSTDSAPRSASHLPLGWRRAGGSGEAPSPKLQAGPVLTMTEPHSKGAVISAPPLSRPASMPTPASRWLTSLPARHPRGREV
jgi:hypothetical protein